MQDEHGLTIGICPRVQCVGKDGEFYWFSSLPLDEFMRTAQSLHAFDGFETSKLG
jgi:hypothetical protein